MLPKKTTTIGISPQDPIFAPKNAMRVPKIQYLRVRDFDKYLHYKDRHLLWIKSYTGTLDEYIMLEIPDHKKWHMHAIILMAARTANRIPNNPTYVQQYIKATEPIDLMEMVDWGLLEFVEDDSNSDSNTDNNFAIKFVPTRKQKRGKSSSKPDSNSGAISEKNLPKPDSTRREEKRTEQKRTEQKRTEDFAAAAAKSERAAAVKKTIAEEPHESPYDFQTVLEYVKATKQDIQNPGGLARTLYRSGDETLQITAWLAEREAWEQQRAEQEARERQQKAEEAQAIATHLIQQGGIRSASEAFDLLAALEFFQPAEPLADDFNARTFRQLRKMIAYATARLRDEASEAGQSYYHDVANALENFQTAQTSDDAEKIAWAA